MSGSEKRRLFNDGWNYRVLKMDNIPQYINFIFETSDGVSLEHEERAKLIFKNVGFILEKEWGVSSPVTIYVSIMSDSKFREGATNGPQTWKYCFLLRDWPNKIYLDIEIFNVLPEEVEMMIKHETTHVIVGQLVGEVAYRKSFLLEEGTAGLDNATERLVAKIKKEEISNIPKPTAFKTIQDIKDLGGDTNKEPFADQLGYLILFSFVEFLKKRHGEAKILEVYKKLADDATLETAYQAVCEVSFSKTISDWEMEVN